MEFKRRTLNQIADMICGNFPAEESFFAYRSSTYLTEFFEDVDHEEFVHDGSTRKYWVAERLAEILGGPQASAHVPPDTFARVIARLMDQEDARNEVRGHRARTEVSALGLPAAYTPPESPCGRQDLAAWQISLSGGIRVPTIPRGEDLIFPGQ